MNEYRSLLGGSFNIDNQCHSHRGEQWAAGLASKLLSEQLGNEQLKEVSEPDSNLLLVASYVFGIVSSLASWWAVNSGVVSCEFINPTVELWRVILPAYIIARRFCFQHHNTFSVSCQLLWSVRAASLSGFWAREICLSLVTQQYVRWDDGRRSWRVRASTSACNPLWQRGCQVCALARLGLFGSLPVKVAYCGLCLGCVRMAIRL